MCLSAIDRLGNSIMECQAFGTRSRPSRLGGAAAFCSSVSLLVGVIGSSRIGGREGLKE